MKQPVTELYTRFSHQDAMATDWEERSTLNAILVALRSKTMTIQRFV